MTEYVEKWGDNIDSAVELALKELKLTKEEVEITVLEQPSRGFFGIGKRLAKVRVEKKKSKPEEKSEVKPAKIEKQEKKEKNESLNSEAKPAKAKKEEKEEKTPKVEISKHEEPEDTENQEEKSSKKKSVIMNTKFSISDEDTDAVLVENSPAALFIENIAQKMDIDVKAEAHSLDGVLYISLKGKEVGTLIGKRGQTLDAVQYLASIVQNKNAEERMRVVVNAENYREKREKTLQSLANRLADKCMKYRKSVRLEPMNPYERKVIHSTLQSHKTVTTRSEGVEPNRRVIIELKK